jgi:hypothetical protein
MKPGIYKAGKYDYTILTTDGLIHIGPPRCLGIRHKNIQGTHWKICTSKDNKKLLAKLTVTKDITI